MTPCKRHFLCNIVLTASIWEDSFQILGEVQHFIVISGSNYTDMYVKENWDISS